MNRRKYIASLPEVQCADLRILHRIKASEQAHWHGALRLVTTKQRVIVAKLYTKHLKAECMERYLYAFRGAQLNYELLYARLHAPNQQYAVDTGRLYAKLASMKFMSYEEYIKYYYGFNWYRYSDEYPVDTLAIC
jgi:hypothetical protein